MSFWAEQRGRTNIPGKPGLDPLACIAQPSITQPTALRGPDSRKCGASQGQKRRADPASGRPANLIRFSPLLLAQSLPRKRFLGPALFSGLHIEAVLLDFLDDVFLLHFALEAAQCIFQRFTLLDNYFSHVLRHPQSGSDWFLAAPLWTSSSTAIQRVGTAPVHNYLMFRPLSLWRS